MIFVQNFFRAAYVADFLGPFFPGHCQQPVQIIARNCGLSGHRRHGLKLLQLLDGLVTHFLGHAGAIDLFLQLVKFALFPAPQFLLDSFDLFVKVVLFLCPLHLSLHPRLDGAVHVQLFDLDVQHVADTAQAFGGIEDFQQFLLFFDGKLQVRRDGVRQFGRILHAHRRDHGFVVERLAKLHVLLKQGSDPLHAGFNLRIGLCRVACHSHRNLHVAIGFTDLKNLATLDAFNQYFNIPVRQFETLNDVDNRAHLINLVGLGFVHTGIVLSGKEDLFVCRQRLFQRMHARFPAHHKRSHHVGEDDHIPNGHHGKFFSFEFLFGSGHEFLQTPGSETLL